MNREEIAAEIASLQRQRVELEEITRAPQRLAGVVSRIGQLQKAAERAEARELAERIAPGWQDRLRVAEAALRDAEAAATATFVAAADRARTHVETFPAGVQLAGEHIPLDMAGIIPPSQTDPPRLIAEMRRDQAAAEVRARRTYPARLAQAVELDEAQAKAAAKAAAEGGTGRGAEAPEVRTMTTSALAGQVYVWSHRRSTRSSPARSVPSCGRAGRPGAPAGSAVVGIYGPMEYRPGLLSLLFGDGTSTLELTATIRRLAGRPERKQIILEIDLPGGSIEGVSEAAAAIRDARKVKPVYAVAAPMAASAAYWLAAQATRLLVMGSGQVGLIRRLRRPRGRFEGRRTARRQDDPGFCRQVQDGGQSVGTALRPGPGRDAIKVDAHYRQFTDDVAFGRGVSPSAVVKGYGEGRMSCPRCHEGRMVDGIGGLDGVLEGIAIERGRFLADLDRRQRRNAALRASLPPRG